MTGGGKLKVQVVNGRGLQNKETFQTSDPYCKLEVGGVSHKTKHVNSNLNPDWNETFEFDIKPGMDVIALSIWDKNTIKKDAFMGYSFVTFDDCKRDQDTEKQGLMLGGCSGHISVIVTPDFETSATKIEKMYIQIKSSSNDEAKEKLKTDVTNLTGQNRTLEDENKKLKEQLKSTSEDAALLSDKNTTLETSNGSLKKELEESNSNNSKLKETSVKLNEEIAKLKTDVARLSLEETITIEVEKPVESARDEKDFLKSKFYGKLNAENEKLIQIKKDLLEKLMGFQTIQDLIFNQMKEKMHAMENNKEAVEKLRFELKEQILGFEKVQELIFNQFNGQMKTFDLSLLKEIVMEVKAFEQC